VRFVKEKTMEMVHGKMSLNQLTISKSLRADYKSVTLPAHKQLANRIAERDPGNAPASGDRIPYVYISAPVGQEASKLQGDRIEHPAFVKANKLSLDTKYYIQHQLLNPLAQLFSLCLSKMPGYRADMSSLDAETAAGNLLFHDALQECENATTRAFANKFNLHVETRTPAPITKKPVAKAPVAKTSKQQTIDFYILDKMYLEEQAAKKKKAAAAAKAEAATATAKSKKKITIET